jgi:hypothetical protein
MNGISAMQTWSGQPGLHGRPLALPAEAWLVAAKTELNSFTQRGPASQYLDWAVILVTSTPVNTTPG